MKALIFTLMFALAAFVGISTEAKADVPDTQTELSADLGIHVPATIVAPAIVADLQQIVKAVANETAVSTITTFPAPPIAYRRTVTVWLDGHYETVSDTYYGNNTSYYSPGFIAIS